MTGDFIHQGTATAGATTSLTDANNERTPVASAKSFSRTFIYIHPGAKAGGGPQEKAPTPPQGVRLKRRPQDILDAIARVTGENQRRLAFARFDDAIVTGSLLGYYGGGGGVGARAGRGAAPRGPRR